MAKFTFEEKLWAVNEYEKGTLSYRDIAKLLGTNHKTIVKWVAIYQAHGEDYLRKNYTNYTAAFKMKVLEFMFDNGASLLETAVKFKIPNPSTISMWRTTVETEGVEALISKKKGRPSMTKERKKNQSADQSKESLIEEVERLRMENAYLKKLNALVREKEKLRQNSKRK
jgi:transposase-like protein